MSCGCGKDKKQSIAVAKNGCCPAPVIEVKSPEEVVMFHKVVVPVALGDESTYPAVKGLYKNVLMVYESNGHAYLYSSDGVPSYISFDTGGVLVVSELPEVSQATVDFIYVTPSGASYITMDGETWVTLSTGESIEFNSITGRPKYAGQEMTSDTNIPSVEEETAARIAADNGLQLSLQSEIDNRTAADTAISQSLSSETAARTAADTTLQNNINAEAITRAATDDSLQDQIDEVDAVASSAVQPEDIDIDVVTNLAVAPNPSTTVVTLDAGKTNLMSKTSSTTNLPLPVASATQAGVMNSATFSAIAQNTQDIANIKGEVVAISNLPASPTQQELTTAWLNTSGEPALINGAGIYDVTNAKRWTYYSNTSTWYALDASGSVTVNTWTNSVAGIVKGSTTTGQIFAESDGTGSVNGWDALSGQVGTNTSKLATIASGAEVNVQSDWADTDSTSDAFIQNKPTNLVQDANYVHTDNNFTTTEKNKLSGIASGAEVNVQTDWDETNTNADSYLKNKPAIPSSLSDLSGTISTAQIADLNVTTAKLANGAVTGVANNATTIGSAKLALATVGTPNLRDSAVSEAKVAGSAISLAKLKRTVLYNNTTGTTGTITLSETAANFTELEIFYRSNDDYYSSVRVYSPNGKFVDLWCGLFGAGGAYFKNRCVSISGTSITTNGDAYGQATVTASSTNYSHENRIYITRVVGYK